MKLRNLFYSRSYHFYYLLTTIVLLNLHLTSSFSGNSSHFKSEINDSDLIYNDTYQAEVYTTKTTAIYDEYNVSQQFDNWTNGSKFDTITITSKRSLFFNICICILCSILILATTIGNALVILSVLIVRKLHSEDNANNYLIVSLAISDFLVGLLVMPFSLYVETNTDNK